MKLLKLFGCAAAMMLAMGALADASNVLLEFSSSGPDLYADGTPALKGEWYALVWSPDGKFGGVSPICEVIREGDAVIRTVPLATGGANSHCPYVVFQLTSAQAKSSGVYSLLLLDTRNAEKTEVATSNAGKPAEVNGVVEAGAYTATGDATTGIKGAVVKTVDAPAWSESVIAGAESLKINDFKVNDATVEISVENMVSGAKYNVLMGNKPSELKNYALEVPQTVDAPKFIIQKDQANFFRVVREPLTK